MAKLIPMAAYARIHMWVKFHLTHVNTAENMLLFAGL